MQLVSVIAGSAIDVLFRDHKVGSGRVNQDITQILFCIVCFGSEPSETGAHPPHEQRRTLNLRLRALFRMRSFPDHSLLGFGLIRTYPIGRARHARLADAPVNENSA
jgi:hypothetical protein